MRYPPEHKEQARTRIVEAAGRAFRRNGYGSVGVDGLAKEAGVTSGAFYGHFRAKDSAFREVAVRGLEELRVGIADLQAAHGAGWIAPFVDFYIGERRTCELGESCALQSLTPDVMRADADTRSAYEEAFEQVVDQVVQGLAHLAPGLARQRALGLLALLSGGVTMARSMASEKSSTAIGDAVRAAARDLVAA